MSANAHHERAGRVTRLLRIDLPVADLSRAAAFYRDGLGFKADVDRRGAEGMATIDGVSNHWLTMRLGEQEIRLVAYDAPGRPYPTGSASSDLWFQHIAIVVSDMARAFARVSAQPGFTAISHDGPQLLPANTGSVTAFKFRDPDGHPLELIHFPQSSIWRDSGDDLFLGYDHSAISVSNLKQSLRFYIDRLGLRSSQHSLNSGAAQARLDGLDDPVVDVNGLAPSAQPTPHLELLCYHVSRDPRAPQPPAIADIAGSQLVLEAVGLSEIAARLKQAKIPFTSQENRFGRQTHASLLLRDPDGHLITLEATGDEREPPGQPPVANPG